MEAGMATHEIVEAIPYVSDGQRHCDGCGQIAHHEGGWSAEYVTATGAILEVSINVKASPFRGEDICEHCGDDALEHIQIHP